MCEEHGEVDVRAADAGHLHPFISRGHVLPLQLVEVWGGLQGSVLGRPIRRNVPWQLLP